jgi:16S rRNA (guanine(527)-N(7))-methyltransferase RsmG
VTSLGEVHRRELERFRHSMNLVGPGPIDEHFVDSELAVADLEPAGRWVDLGSGAGFPGLVFADLYPEVAIELVDSREKRCWFLEHVLALAPRPGVVVRCSRVETLPSETYDGVISRAFAPPAEVAEHARRLLTPSGQLVLLLQEDALVPLAPGFGLVEARSYRVGGKARRREVWTLQER